MKRLLPVLFLLAAAVLSAREIAVPELSPIFSAPDHYSRVIAVAGKGVQGELLEVKRVLVSKHPLARYYDFYHVRLEGGVEGYFDPESVVVDERANFKRGIPSPFWHLPVLTGLAALLAAAIVVLVKMPELRGWRRVALWGTLPVLTRMFLLLLVVHLGGNLIANPADEPGYYGNLVSFLSGDYSQPWHFTVGLSIFYLPFELLSGSRNLVDILVPFSWFAGFVLAPGSLVFGYLIGRKLLKSDARAMAAMLIWAVLPFVFHHTPDFAGKWMRSYFELPTGSFSFRHYITLIGSGFNAMSDVPSTFIMLLSFYLAISLKPRVRSIALVLFLFAFGCMIRINNIFFLPALGLIYLFWHPAYFRSARGWATAAPAGTAGFLIGFLPQFIANAGFFGNPLQFSYTRYAEGAHTYFHPVFIKLNSGYYGSVNHLLWLLAIPALCCGLGRKNRTLLVWWAVPIILFFFGYSHGTDDPIRFILTSFPAFCIAIAGARWWKPELTLREVLPLAVILLAWIFTLPNPTFADWGYYLEAPYRFIARSIPFTLSDLLLMGMAAGAALYLYKRRRALGGYALAASFFYWFGNAYLLGGGLLLLLLRAAVEGGLEIYRQHGGKTRFLSPKKL